MPRSRKSTASSVSRRRKSGGASFSRTKTESSLTSEMSASARFSVGIDPGYGCAGVVLVDHGVHSENLVAFGLFRDLLGTGFPTSYRSQALATQIVTRLCSYVGAFDIRSLAIGIELPIYNRNAETYFKQATLHQALVTAIASHLTQMVDALWIAEPNPSESKHLATGSGAATKAEMYKRSPFVATEFAKEMARLEEDERHTLSDAWAHSLSARKGCERRYDLKALAWQTYSQEVDWE